MLRLQVAHRFTHHIAAVLLLAVILVACGIDRARAQLPSGPSSQLATAWGPIEVIANPYIWFPWTTVDVQSAGANASQTISPGDLISHLTWVPFMGAAEFRSGPFGLAIDYVHAPIKSGIGTRQILFGSAQGQVGLDIGTAMFLYRTTISPAEYVDLGIGVRAWGLDGSIALSQGALRPVTVSNGTAWADPLIAARYRRDFGNGFSATAYADFGGFGAGANIDWQLIGMLDYTIRPGVELHAGFRSLNFNIGATSINTTVHMNGPIISATYRF